MQMIKVKDLQSALEMKAHNFAEAEMRKFQDQFFDNQCYGNPVMGWEGFKRFVADVKADGKATGTLKQTFSDELLEGLSDNKVGDAVSLLKGMIYYSAYKTELARLETELVSMAEGLHEMVADMVQDNL